MDDLLLLIDGIPAGGAFIPQVEAISLNNVERIEVMRGAAPVYFGTTAFAGTINVIHYAAGSADRVTGFHFGSYQSGGVGGAAVLSSGRVRQSISGELSQNNLSDERADYRRAQGIWRLATQLGGGNVPRRRGSAGAAAEARQPGADRRSDRGVQHAAAGRLQPESRERASWTPIATRSSLDYDVPLSFGALGQHGRLHADAHRQRAWLHRRRGYAAAVDAEDQRRSRILQTVTESQRALHRQQSDDAAERRSWT